MFSCSLRLATRSWTSTGIRHPAWIGRGLPTLSRRHMSESTPTGQPPLRPTQTPGGDEGTGAITVPAWSSVNQEPEPAFRRVVYRPPKAPATIRTPKPIYRAVFINDLDDATTLTDVLQAIAQAGPIGMVLAAVDLRSASGKHGVSVEFNRASAADLLVEVSRRRGFTINGIKPYVKQNRVLFFYNEHFSRSASRVVRLIGDPHLEGFHEEGLRAVLKQDPELVDLIKTGSPNRNWGFDSEPARESTALDGRKIIDWPFFSSVFQAKPFMIALRKHFGAQLQIEHGDDPCGPPEEPFLPMKLQVAPFRRLPL